MAQPQRAPSRLPLTDLWYSRGPGPTPFNLALRSGWIAEELGADGTALHALREPSTHRAAPPAAGDRTHGALIRQGGIFPALWAHAHGRDTRLVGLTWTDAYQVVLGRTQSGIRTAHDLQGRRLGIPRRAQPRFDPLRADALRGFENALATAGYSLPGDAVLVDVEVADDDGQDHRAPRPAYAAELAALARGEVDAVYLSAAAGFAAADGAHAHVVIDLGAEPDARFRATGATLQALTVDSALAERHPEVVTRLLARIRQAGEWAVHHGPEVRRMAARDLGTTVEGVTRAYGPRLHRHLLTDLEPERIQRLGELAAFLARWGFIGGELELGEWIDPRFLIAAAQRQQAVA